jgi:hypothetical protein
MDDVRFARLLADVLQEAPTRAPDGLLDAVTSNVAGLGQRRRLSLGSARWPLDGRWSTGLAMGAAGLAIGLVITAGLLGPLGDHGGPGTGPSQSPSPTTSPTVSPSPGTSPSIAAEAWFMSGPSRSLEDFGADLLSGVQYTSDVFRPTIRFRLPAFGGRPIPDQETDWCGYRWIGDHPNVSERMLRLDYKMACQSHLMIIRPSAVDCGTPDPHPDASALAAALFANAGLGAVAGRDPTPGDGGVGDWDLGGGPIQRIDIPGARAFDAARDDPDACTLVAAPGDPVVELRGDLPTRLFVFDHGGELMVIRLSGGGWDSDSAAAARDGGDVGSPDWFSKVFDVMARYISELRLD